MLPYRIEILARLSTWLFVTLGAVVFYVKEVGAFTRYSKSYWTFVGLTAAALVGFALITYQEVRSARLRAKQNPPDASRSS